jgi:sensor histidine kinase YesM
MVAIGNPLKAADSIFFSVFAAKYIFYVVFQAIAVYFNLYFLVPRFLEKNRYVVYFSLLTLTIVGCALLIVPGYYLPALLTHRTIEETYGAGSCFFGFFGGATLPSTVAAMTLAMSIKLAKNWIQTQRRQQLLEKEKLETELKFLKYQFNPHFLFNTINSIFFLIHKNPDMASASLAKFSELLRYQLYECNDIQIALSKEIAYLENFIELERLRRNDNIAVHFRMGQPPNGHLGIAPFILMTFVENAFKHVSTDNDRPNRINIELELEGQQLYFAVTNSTAPDVHKDVLNYGGIGLPNVRRRLELLYAGQYQLDIQHSHNSFEVKLQLQLSELVMSPAFC